MSPKNIASPGKSGATKGLKQASSSSNYEKAINELRSEFTKKHEELEARLSA